MIINKRQLVASIYCVLMLCLQSGGAAYAQSTSEGALDDLFRFVEEEQVVISSSGVAQRIEEAPSIISVITREELRRAGYRSIAEALAHLPGLSFVDDHLLPNLTIRGIYGGPRGWGRLVKVLIDGQQTTFLPGNSHWLGLAAIPLDIVDRIEVIRGPASAMYGANAFLGVINIITKDPDGLPTAMVHSGGILTENNPGGEGSLSLSYASATWHLQGSFTSIFENRSGLHLSQTYDRQTTMDLRDGRRSQNDTRFPKSMYLRAGLKDTGFGTLELSGFLQQLDGSGEFQDFGVLTHQTRISRINGYGRLRWQHQATNSLQLRAEAAYIGGGALPNERLHFEDTERVYRQRVDYRGGNGLLEATYHLTPTTHLRVGTDVWMADQADPSGIRLVLRDDGSGAFDEEFADPPTRTLFLNVGAYAQGHVQLWDWALATAGLRVDHHNLYGTDLSARAALVLLVHRTLSIKALYGTAIMAPAADQLYSRPFEGTVGLRGNSDLHTQKSQTGEIGLDYKPGSWLTLRLNGFVTQVRDSIEFERIGIVRRPLNRDSMLVMGGEFEGRATVDRFNIRTTLGYGRGTREQPGTIGIPDPADALFTAAPWLTASCTLNVALPEIYLNAYLEGRYRGPQDPSRENFVRNDRRSDYELPAAFFLDATLTTMGFSLNPASANDTTMLYLRAVNILDARPAQPGYNGIDIPTLGRAFFVGLQHQFF